MAKRIGGEQQIKPSANIINQDNIKIRTLSFKGGDRWVKFDKQIEF